MYQDTTTRDELIFPLAIMRILRHFSIPIPNSPYFTTMGAISASFVQWSEAQLQPKWPCVEMDDPMASAVPPSSLAPSTYAPSSLATGVTLEAIMVQL